jgi:hypothetical protein
MNNNIKQVWKTVVCTTNPRQKKVNCGISSEFQLKTKWEQSLTQYISQNVKEDIAKVLGVSVENLKGISIWDLELPLAT